MDKWRPDLTSHEQIAQDVAAKVNAEALYQLTETDICKLALERFWRDAHPGEELPAGLKRKRYIRLQF
jgi:hypothetical protein